MFFVVFCLVLKTTLPQGGACYGQGCNFWGRVPANPLGPIDRTQAESFQNGHFEVPVVPPTKKARSPDDNSQGWQFKIFMEVVGERFLGLQMFLFLGCKWPMQ